MKKCIIALTAIVLLTSCMQENETYDLLSNPDKWKGDVPAITDDGAVIEGEFRQMVYNPGLFKSFTNFELTALILTHAGANASIVFHTNNRDTEKGYEIHIDNNNVGDWDRLKKTGSLSSVRNVYYNTVSNEEWFRLKVSVIENHVSITLNDYPVVDYIEPPTPYRLQKNKKKRISHGTFAIKTFYSNSSIEIKELTVQSLPPGEISTNDDPEFTKQITRLHSRNFPVVDYHVHEKGDLTMPKLIEQSAKIGINYGIAANCGLKFPIQTNEALEAYLFSIEGLPIFKAMQAEGREWVDMFSPELIKKFDYAFTDAMTWTNNNGVRMRLWIQEETDVGDPEDFMEQLVSQIEKVVTEPISIYVNPTYLPEELADRYDELWTDERIDRVIQALLENSVALEINSSLQLPGKRVIRKAKEAGVKFAMGTNNTNSENLGRLEWAINMLNDLEIQPTDMFLPTSK